MPISKWHGRQSGNETDFFLVLTPVKSAKKELNGCYVITKTNCLENNEQQQRHIDFEFKIHGGINHRFSYIFFFQLADFVELVSDDRVCNLAEKFPSSFWMLKF